MDPVAAKAYFGLGLVMPARARVTIGWPAGAVVDDVAVGADGVEGELGDGARSFGMVVGNVGGAGTGGDEGVVVDDEVVLVDVDG